MPITAEFEYVKPRTLDDALHVLSMYKASARVLAGGTDLIVHLKEGLAAPEVVVDIKGLADLGGVTFNANGCRVGALVTFSDLIGSPAVKKAYPLLWESALTVASTGVRNRATVAGNICSAVPSADSAPVLAVYGATVVLASIRGERRVSINEWFAGPKKTVREADEIVTAVELPAFGKHGGCYMKLSRYEGEDLAQGGIAALAFPDNTYRVAHCALGPTPARCPRTEEILDGNKLTPALLARAKEAVLKEISPIDDIRSSKEYRLHMAQVMLERSLQTAVARLFGKPPAYGTENIA